MFYSKAMLFEMSNFLKLANALNDYNPLTTLFVNRRIAMLYNKHKGETSEIANILFYYI